MSPSDAIGPLVELEADRDELCAVLKPTKESSTPTTASSTRSKRSIGFEAEGASSTDSTRHDTDSLVDSDHDVASRDLPSIEEQWPMLPIDSTDGIDEDHEDLWNPGIQTPDPFDSVPYVQVPPAFSESEIAEAFARHALTEELQADTVEHDTLNWPSEMIAVPFPVPVPMHVPMPQPFMRHLPLPLPMPLPVGPSALLPPGFKLVPIPEMQPPRKSTVLDPADNDRKIFVGGLSPATTEISLVKYFSNFGPVEDATVVREANKSRGFGFVQFREGIPSEILEMKHIIDQRRCGVSVAVPRTKES
jgi:hypothetical protein